MDRLKFKVSSMWLKKLFILIRSIQFNFEIRQIKNPIES